jgi:hypothetical protein
MTEKFDAYGEVLPEGERESASHASAMINRVGQSVFWLLVVMIVSARILFYPLNMGPAFDVGSAPAVNQVATR